MTVVSGHSPVYRWVKHLNSTFISSVDRSLQGADYSIRWDEQYSGSLAGVGDELETIEAGLAELGIVPSVFDAAKLGVQNVTYFTPFVSSDAKRIANLMDELHASEPEIQGSWHANGVEYLGGAIGLDDYLLMTTSPIHTLKDLKGLKIAAPGPAINWLKGTGAVGVSGNLATYYNDIRAGVYDGAITFATAALPGKLYEVAPYITLVHFGAQYAGGIAANKVWFDALPDVVQRALKNAAVAHREAYLDDLDIAVNESLSRMIELGAVVTEVDEGFQKLWVDNMDNVATVWAQRLDKAGQPGTAVLNMYMNKMRDAGASPARNWDQK
ncbi:MAG: C4-dicarboxylate TRAP transporter substrate-binding protein [Granulosicoccus sp.]